MLSYYTMLAPSLKPPTREDVRKLTMLDIAIMNGLADSFRNTLKKYIQIDPYTMPDPFGSEDEYNYSVILDRQEPRRVVAMIKDEYNYSVILDRQEPRRVVAMFASKLESLPQLPWEDILGDRLIRLSLSRSDANALKNELMPKDTNNFYQYRRSGKVNGYVMFAFQICGQR
ncbi:MAG TPA: hypothetical protein VEL11_04760 [Candidatus Bathyarchaeia archaeon]|nr:hypothetical protein [Candidatus Bathyarchaeia archaeon]